MTQRITVGFVGANFATLQAALASLTVGVPFSEPIVLEVHASTPEEAITVPSGLQPTAANPLILYAFRGPDVASPFSDYTIDSGAEAVLSPPAPRLQRPALDSLDIQCDHVVVNGFQVNGDLSVTADTGVSVESCLVHGGRIHVVRGAATVVDILVASCVVQGGSLAAGIVLTNVDGVRLYHNTVLQRVADAGAPCYALEITNAGVEAKNNLLAGAGVGGYAIRFTGDPADSIFAQNFYAAFDGAKLCSFSDGGPVVETSDLNVWVNFAGATGSLSGDPEFRDRLSSSAPNLDVANTSPVIGAASALADVQADVRSERRPVDYVTIGAYEHAEVVTESGQRRFLELLAGLSAAPITKAVLGNAAYAGDLNTFPRPLVTDDLSDALFTPVAIEGVVAPGSPGQEGLVIFRPAFQVTLPMYTELLDSVPSRANKVGLLAGDDAVFLIKRIRSIPFDATGFLSTQVSIPLEVV